MTVNNKLEGNNGGRSISGRWCGADVRPRGTTGPHCHNSLLPRSGPQRTPHASFLPSFLPSSGWKSCRQGGDVLSVVAFAPRNSAFSYRRIGEEKKKKKNRNHPRFRIQHVRGRRANQVGRQILFFSLPRFFPPSSSLMAFISFFVYLFDTFDCFSKTCLDRGGRDVAFHWIIVEMGFSG